MLKQAQVSRIGEINRCGTCDACCTALGIADDQLKKIEGAPCEHLCASGCGIYETRPSVCRSFECQWLQIGGSEKYRPDNSGLLCFSQQFHPAIGVAVQVTELFKGATESQAGRHWIAKLSDYLFPTLCGDRVQLPIGIIRFRSSTEISKRPTRWLVSKKNIVAIEYLRNEQESDRIRFRTSPNSPCRCGSGIKFKKCHAKFLELIITE